jgi:hypothetical protein
VAKFTTVDVDVDVDASGITIDDDHRSLQEAAAQLRVIEVAIVVDFLRKYGGDDKSYCALEHCRCCQQVYEVPGYRSWRSYLEIHCDPATDPIQPLLTKLAPTLSVPNPTDCFELLVDNGLY